MIFITLVKWKTAPNKEHVDQFTKTIEELEKQGIKMRVYWTLGRYDLETMVAVPRDEAIKLL